MERGMKPNLSLLGSPLVPENIRHQDIIEQILENS